MKQTYQTPRIEIISVNSEGVMAMSDVTGGGGIFTSPSTSTGNTKQSGNNASLDDLENLINDLLTQ